MQQWRVRHFVGDDALVLTDLGKLLLMEGEIGCQGRIVVSVFKVLEVVDRARDGERVIQSAEYAYNARIQGAHNLFRYDNSHSRDGHPTDHHKHTFDWRTGNELEDSPVCIGDDWAR